MKAGAEGSTERLFEREMSRRRALQVGGGLALAAALSGCQLGSGSGIRGDSSRVIEPKLDGDLVLFNWAQYLNPKLVSDFEREYGVAVRSSNFDSMPGMLAKLRSGNRYDLIFPTAEYVKKLITADALLRIPREKLTAIDDVYPFFDDPWYDPGSEHSVPYSLYLTGLGYRADEVTTMTGSWRDIINPDADGRCFMLDDFQEGVGMANLVSGYELNAVDPAELEVSKDYLLEIKPSLRGYTSDTITSMSSGNAWIQHLWNGDVVSIRYRVDDPTTIKFQQNREGVPVGSDVFAIPANAEHPGTALLFIDFVLANSAENATWTGYPMPTNSSEKPYAELVRGEPELQITLPDLERGEQFADLEGLDRENWDRVWTEVKAA